MKTKLLKLNTNFVKYFSFKKEKCTNSMRGFTLGVAMIIMGILVTISVGMSALILKDLKLVSITEKSSIAYNIADSILACTTSYENHIRYINPSTGADEAGLFPTSTLYNYDTNYKENYTTADVSSQLNFDKNSIKCFDLEILDTSNPDPKNITSIVAATSANAPANYIGGVRTTIKVQSDYMKSKMRDACAEVEIYSAPTQDKLFVAKGKVPCTGSKVVERVIVKSVQ